MYKKPRSEVGQSRSVFDANPSATSASGTQSRISNLKAAAFLNSRVAPIVFILMSVILSWFLVDAARSSETLDLSRTAFLLAALAVILLAIPGAMILGRNQAREAEELRRRIDETLCEPSFVVSGGVETGVREVKESAPNRAVQLKSPMAFISERHVLWLFSLFSAVWTGWILALVFALRMAESFIIAFSIIGICNSTILLYWWLSLRRHSGD